MNIKKDHGIILKKLISIGIININDARKEVYETKNPIIMYHFMIWIDFNNRQNLIKRIVLLGNDRYVLNALLYFADYDTICWSIDALFKFNKVKLLEDLLFLTNNILLDKVPNESELNKYLRENIDTLALKILNYKNFDIIERLILKADKLFSQNNCNTKTILDNYLYKKINLLLNLMCDCVDLYRLKKLFNKLESSTLKSIIAFEIKARDINELKKDDNEITLNLLMYLYQKNDIETIKANREIFANLFQEPESEKFERK